jgi:hypothetical protein
LENTLALGLDSPLDGQGIDSPSHVLGLPGGHTCRTEEVPSSLAAPPRPTWSSQELRTVTRVADITRVIDFMEMYHRFAISKKNFELGGF